MSIRQVRREGKFVRVAKNIGAVASAAGKALSVATAVAALLNVELKYFDTRVLGTASSAGTITNISNMIEGTGESERNGDSIEVKSIQCRILASKNVSALATCLRVIVFSDLMADGANPTVAEVLHDVTTNAGVISPLSMEQAGRFKIYEDIVMTLNGGGDVLEHLKYYEEVDHTVNFIGATGVAAAMSHGQLYVLAISNEPTNDALFWIYTRVRYIDN